MSERRAAWNYSRFESWDAAAAAAVERQRPVWVTIYSPLSGWCYAVVYPDGRVDRHGEPRHLERTGTQRRPDPRRPCRFVVVGS